MGQARAATAVLSTAAKAKALKEEAEKKATANGDVDMDDKASVSLSLAEGASAKERGDAVSVVSVAATPGTTVVGSAADSVAADDLGSEHMEVDAQANIEEEKP